MLEITAIPALRDNYIWVIHNGQHALLVDPGVAQPALDFLAQHQLQLQAILCTHRHHDHINGIQDILAVYNVPVYGKAHPNNPHITHPLNEGEQIQFQQPQIQFQIMETPGHLEDHIVYWGDNKLFCGDMMFGAGCGRNFEGSLLQLHQSLQRLSTLPDHTQIYCAHEYTSANLRFALACEPNNPAIQQRIEQTQQLRQQNRPSLPSTLALEKATNPFLRTDSPELQHTLQQQQRWQNETSAAIFSSLRLWRNEF